MNLKLANKLGTHKISQMLNGEGYRLGLPHHVQAYQRMDEYLKVLVQLEE